MGEILYLLIYQPLFNLLIFLYNLVPFPDLGIAVILLTFLVKGVLYPLGIKAARSQREMQIIQPEVKKIQEKYKDNKEEQARKIMELYRERKVSPFSGMGPLIIQLPILISLFQIFRRGLENEEMKHLYDFVTVPETVNYHFLGIIDLSSPHALLAILAAAGQYAQMKMTMKNKEDDNSSEKKDMAKAMQSQMIMFLPGFTFIVLLSLPSAVGLYWLVTIIFSIFQQYIVQRDKSKENKNGGDKKNN